MKIAALILGIIAGLAGLVGAGVALVVGGLGSALQTSGSSTVMGGAFAALAFSILGIVGAAIALKAPRTAGWLMIVAGVGGLIAVSLAYVVSAPLFVIGGILALVGARKPREATPSVTPPAPTIAPEEAATPQPIPVAEETEETP